MTPALFQMLNSIHPISDALKEELVKRLQRKEVEKKEFLLKEGQTCNNIYFVENGFFKAFYRKDGKEIVQWFMGAIDVIISVRSFYNRTASYEYIQAIEDATVYFVSYDDLQFLYKNYVEFNVIGRVLTEKYYALSEERLMGLRKQKAEERYNFLLQYHPQIIQKSSRTDIASYLGISLETLSRISYK
jgi:CRP/FNR family transcriptional regulator, anaerobic regulatory protein